MGKAQMSNDFEQSNESDDLIAELARLMAQDAKQGGRQERAEQVLSSSENATNDNANFQEQTNQADIALEEAQISAPQIDKTLEKVLSASERLSAIQSAREVSEPKDKEIEQVGTNQTQVQEDLQDDAHEQIQTEIGEDEIISQSENNEPDPIAKLILKQLKSENGENLTDAPSEDTDNDNLSLNTKAQIKEELLEGEQETDNIKNIPTSPQFSDNNIQGNIEQTIASNNINVDFSQNSTPSSQKEDVDPLIEIERLIGEAVRDGGRAEELSGDNLDEVKIEQNVDEVALAAESSILAASMDSEKELASEHVASQQAGDFSDEAKPKSSFLRSILGPSIAGAILLAGGFGLYYFLNQGSSDNEAAPILSASNEPEKAAPQTNNTKDSEQSIVLEEISGEERPAQEERLVSRDESQENIVASSSTSEPRIITTNNETQTAIANRKVKTVTVRPDGTIVSGESARAGNEALPVDRPNVPDLPAGTTNAAAEQANQPIVSNQGQIEIATTNAPAPESNTAPANANAQANSTNSATPPAPQTRPEAGNNANNNSAVDLLANSAGQNATPVTQIITTSPPPPAQSANLTKAPAYVQLSSQRAQETAQRSLIELKTRFTSILGDKKLEIQRADLGDKGIYYRVRVPAQSIENANNICNNIKLAGGDCFVRTD